MRTAGLPAITNGGSSNGNTARLPPITYGNLTSPTAPLQQGHSRSEKMPALGDNTMASFANLDNTGLEDNDDVDYMMSALGIDVLFSQERITWEGFDLPFKEYRIKNIEENFFIPDPEAVACSLEEDRMGIQTHLTTWPHS